MKARYLLSLTILGLSISAVNAEEYQPLKSGSGLCLDVFNAGVADKTPVTPFSCHGRANQQWLMDSLGRLHPKNAPDKCLEVGRHVTYNKTAYIARCNNEIYQRWSWSGNSIHNQSNPYMVLDYYADRQLIGAWQFHGGPNQQWEWVKSEKPTTTTKPKKPIPTDDVRNIMLSVNIWGEYNNRGWEGQSKIREKGNFKLYNAVVYLDQVEGYDLGNDEKYQPNRSLDPSNLMTRASISHIHDIRGEAQAKQHSKQLLAFFKEYVGTIVQKEKRAYPNKNLRFSLMVHGHGGPNKGSLFESRLFPEDARELLTYIKTVSGQKLAMLDIATLCNEGFWANISNFAPYADYILASEFLSGGLTSSGKFVSEAHSIPEKYYPEAFNSELSVREIAVNRLNKVEKYTYPYYNKRGKHTITTQQSKSLFDSSKVDQFVCSLKGIQGDLVPERHHDDRNVHDVKKYLLALKAHGTNGQNKINGALKAYDNLVIHHVTNEKAMPETWSKYRSYGLSILNTHSLFTNPTGKDLFEAFTEVMHRKPQCKQ
ncbi:RICIN domain-containing protein [Spartinivicinus ruber]|uniref:RICIN domain-containing protein n=1 Tax=Spartinivicinus ruber TaxID=2683272 RepID=UPI0013D7BE2A|nr:RICIN domain-containing protein [Spartinivicinus ruber]